MTMTHLAGRNARLILEVENEGGAVRYALPVSSDRLARMRRGQHTLDAVDTKAYLHDLVQDLALGAELLLNPAPVPNWGHVTGGTFLGSIWADQMLVDVYRKDTPLGPQVIVRYGNEHGDTASTSLADSAAMGFNLSHPMLANAARFAHQH